MATVESHFDRIYRQVSDILAKQMPTEEVLRNMIEEAGALKCGFIVERGKPGTLKISPFVPMNTIVSFDPRYLDTHSAADIKLPGWERFQA
jgi:hypothetical protein